MTRQTVLRPTRSLTRLARADGLSRRRGTDCRNYGVVEGLPEARTLFAELLEVEPAEVIVGGNSSPR
jgi:hypothetical protein